MSLAIEQAQLGESSGEVPVGAVVVSSQGDILSKAHNCKESEFNPAGHAEVKALESAGKKIKNWRLVDCALFVTLEPCPMCLAALIHARVSHVYFGAYDAKGGALSLGYNFSRDKNLNHQFAITGGIRHYECSKILSSFFKQKRAYYRGKKEFKNFGLFKG